MYLWIYSFFFSSCHDLTVFELPWSCCFWPLFLLVKPTFEAPTSLLERIITQVVNNIIIPFKMYYTNWQNSAHLEPKANMKNERRRRICWDASISFCRLTALFQLWPSVLMTAHSEEVLYLKTFQMRFWFCVSSLWLSDLLHSCPDGKYLHNHYKMLVAGSEMLMSLKGKKTAKAHDPDRVKSTFHQHVTIRRR